MSRAVTKARGGRPWTAEMDAALRAAYAAPVAVRLAALDGLVETHRVTRAAARSRARRLGLDRVKAPDWTPAQVQLMRDWYGLVPAHVLAGRLGRTERAVNMYASRRLRLTAAENRRARLAALLTGEPDAATRRLVLLGLAANVVSLTDAAALLRLTPAATRQLLHREVAAAAALVGGAGARRTA